MKTERLIFWVIGALVVLYLVKQSGILTGLQSQTTYTTTPAPGSAGGTLSSLLGSGVSDLQEYDGDDE